jgi:hypothetical protein
MKNRFNDRLKRVKEWADVISKIINSLTKSLSLFISILIAFDILKNYITA